MHYGLQLAASGMLTSLYRTDVFAGNLANLNTTGFKPDTPFTRQRDVARVEDNAPFLPSSDLLERLGAGAHLAPNEVNFGQAPLRQTGNPLDLALEGEGFIVLRDSSDQGQTGLLFTRDGRLSRDADGRLVQAASGKPVMSAQGGTITLPAGSVTISGAGEIRSGDRLIGTIRLADAGDRTQGYLEDSGVNEIRTLLSLQAASKAVGSNTRMIQYHDRMIDRAINALGRSV